VNCSGGLPPISDYDQKLADGEFARLMEKMFLPDVVKATLPCAQADGDPGDEDGQ
jgi:hypothetical protein